MLCPSSLSKVADVNRVSSLLDWRIGFDLPNAIFFISSEPVVDFDARGDLYLPGRATANVNIARPGRQIQINRTRDGKSLLKAAFRGRLRCRRRETGKTHSRCYSEHRTYPSLRFHKSSLFLSGSLSGEKLFVGVEE